MKPRRLGLLLAALLTCPGILPANAYHDIAGGPIVVNDQELNSEQGRGLMQLYGPIAAGDYWYDPYSGLWGPAGGPSTGQILPGLDIGGRLRADASASGTGVFVNGRELHPLEIQRLMQLYGSVTPGRYWMNAQLVGGFEGGPASFDLNAAAAAANGAYGGYGGGYGGGQGSGYNRNTIGGGLMSDGNCSGYLHPGGTTVMTGDC